MYFIYVATFSNKMFITIVNFRKKNLYYVNFRVCVCGKNEFAAF